MWDLSSQTKDWTGVPWIARQILNHWTTRQVPGFFSLAICILGPSMSFCGASLIWVQSLGREDTLEEGMTIRSSTLVWRIPWTEEPGRLQPLGHTEQNTTEATKQQQHRQLVFLWLDSSFYHWNTVHYIDLPDLFIHSPTEGQRGCFRVLASMKSDVINKFLV